jgi:predicted phosphoribosyltransferase
MFYINRHDAALKLIPLLSKYKESDCVVLAIPRGGVPIGYYIAKELHFQMDLLLTKKIGHPLNSELAIGAVSLEDEIVENYPYIPRQYIDEKIIEIRSELKNRFKKFMGNRKPIALKNKTVIIVDDGIATGNTLFAAIPMIQNKSPKKIVVAVPVAPSDTAEKIRNKVDEFICPHITDNFSGVGSFYRNFSQVSDDEVIKLIDEFDIVDNKTSKTQ